MNLEFLNALIEKCEKTVNSPNPNKCSSGDFLVLVNGTKNFRDFCLRYNSSAYFIFEELFSPNGFDRQLGTFRPKDIESEVKLILIVLKKVKNILEKEKLYSEKERIAKIEQIFSHSNHRNNFGGTFHENFNFNFNQEKPSSKLQKLFKWLLFIATTILTILKIK